MDSMVNDDEQVVLRPILESARTIVAATTQIDLAMREAQEPVEDLARSISRIGLALAALAASDLDAQTRAAVKSLQQELAGTIRSMQFFDRMTQHLGHVNDYLGGIASELASAAERGRTSNTPWIPQLNSTAWNALRDRLFHRLISDPQRQLLEMLLPAEETGQQMKTDSCREHYAAQGTVEFF